MTMLLVSQWMIPISIIQSQEPLLERQMILTTLPRPYSRHKSVGSLW